LPCKWKTFADCRCTVGEGIIWNQKEKALYWLDLFEGHIYRSKKIGDYQKFKLNIGKIGGMVFCEDDSLLLFAEHGDVWQWQPNEQIRPFARLEAAAETRFNDVIAAPGGEVYCGVSPDSETGKPGSLWMMDTNKEFTCLEAEVGNPNGMGFSPDLKYFYFTSTRERIIYRYDYSQSYKKITNKVAFIKVPPSEGFPDGMTVDSEGCIWSAQWNGSRIVKYSLEGKKNAEYFLPTKKVTSIAFGGAELSQIYITTANYQIESDEQNAGNVFELNTKFSGRYEFKSNIN
jgi:D-xylono/L-arabinono-1,4-lactonase